MKMLKKANQIFEYLIWFGILLILAFSVYNNGGINILSHLLISASLFVFGFIFYIRNSNLKREGNNLKIGLETVFLILFLLFFLISFVLSQTKNVGLFELILFVSGVFFYLFFSSQKWDIARFEKLLLGVLIIGIIFTLYGYYLYVFEPFNRFSSTFGISIYKFVSYPNAFANFIIAVLPIAFYFLHKKISKYKKGLIISAVIIMLTAFLLTYSRGGLVALSIISIIYITIILLNKASIKNLIKKIVLLFLIIIISGILTIPINYAREMNTHDVNLFTEKISFDSDEEDVSATNRFDFWTGSLKLFTDNPVFGTGPGSFQYVFPVYQKSFLGNSNSPHNLFLKILVENGILAVISFIVFLLILFLRILKIYKNISGSDRLIFFVLSASVLGSLLHNMVDYNLNFVSTNLLLFIFLGMIAYLTNKYSKLKVHKARDKIIKIILVVTGAIMLFVSFHDAYYSYVFKKARALHKESEYAAAIVNYEKSRNIFLKRDLFIVYAQMYNEKYEKEGDREDLYKAKNFLLEGMKLNNRDAFLVNYLGDIAYELNNLEEAEDYYGKALKMDPKNNLDYYYDILKVDDDLTRQEIDNALELLSNYEKQLALNAHLTVLTGNPESAMMIYELLLDKIEDSEFYPEYKYKILEGISDMEDTYADEKEKFENYYDLELKKEE